MIPIGIFLSIFANFNGCFEAATLFQRLECPLGLVRISSSLKKSSLAPFHLPLLSLAQNLHSILDLYLFEYSLSFQFHSLVALVAIIVSPPPYLLHFFVYSLLTPNFGIFVHASCLCILDSHGHGPIHLYFVPCP